MNLYIEENIRFHLKTPNLFFDLFAQAPDANIEKRTEIDNLSITTKVNIHKYL